MIASSTIIQLYAAISRLPYAWIERLTRYLIQNDHWPHRRNKTIRVEYLASLICAIPALQSSDAMISVRCTQSLILEGFLKTLAPPQIALDNLCAVDDAVFDRGGPNHPSLYDYIISMIRELAFLDPLERHARVARLRKAGFSISVSIDPSRAAISWYEADGDRRVQHTMRWKSAQSGLPFDQSDVHEGVERLTRIPVGLLLTAAEIYAQVLRDSAKPDLGKPPSGNADQSDVLPLTHDDAALAGAAPSRVVDDALPSEAQSKRAYPLATLNKDQDGNSAASDAEDAKRVCENAQAISSCCLGRPLQLLGGLY